ncbi:MULTISPECIES: dimethyl sulfoxide reductase anchor subunit family protein [Gordonibacter]|uniref:DMSO reductase n=1 Tax=Gordonibacter faecis TaxID=3047475 RepID=A0ABT7DP61_9ACTN|nr:MULTISPECIES: hypothetical protein [unclassified Gordonibacter]MDJ1651325.1 hypothetical protein [Gordonibacter sp. KGMB12511]HIW76270.1 hypothetical protein [Candidatus Gordonibacter avicola]
MELQWPLIVFTTLVAWSAGLFASQCALALKGEGKKTQMIAWIVSAALLVVGGIAVFLHLEHWERIFNGFGHLTSGITQELIAIVVLAVVAVIYLAFLRKAGDEGKIPSWLAVLGIVVSVVLVVVMAHSYMMAARPAWNSVLWIVYVVGNACVLGPATMALLCSLKGDASPFGQLLAVVGAAVNAVATVAYLIAMQMSGAAFTNVGSHFTTITPMNPAIDYAALTNVFTGEQALLTWLGVVLVGAVVPLAALLVAKKQGKEGSWKMWAAVAIVAAAVGAVCMRVVFYNLGASIFMFY